MKGFLSAKKKLILVINIGIRVKTRYEAKMLKLLEEVELEEGAGRNSASPHCN
jgi:hypothetical protein